MAQVETGRLTRSKVNGGNFPHLEQYQQQHTANTEPLSKPEKENFAPSTNTNKETAAIVPSHKQNQKQLCSTPPAVLKDKKATVSFTKGKFLGEGGFARCYEVWDVSGKKFASKVIAKSSLKSPKSKQKLFTEIKIHQNMRHAHIVQFHHVFEDAQNVYLILELCESRTFVELMKKKKRLSEAETRFYAKQLLDAISYMHKKKVIHRDLKLGNLFLNNHMDIKIGDFGLATVLMSEDERKKTICGTPNYIAPEVLFDRKNGHSFEVDLWSFGVILYTMLIGRPPFQTKDVQEIYRKIRDNDYEFPDSVPISPHVKALISSLLTTKPEMRPSIDDMLSNPWMRNDFSVKELAPKVLMTPPPALKVFGLRGILTPSKQENQAVLAVTNGPNSNASMTKSHAKKAIAPYPTPEKPVAKTPKTNIPIQNQVDVSPLVPRSTNTRQSMLEKIHQNLACSLQEFKTGKIPENFLLVSDDKICAPKVFISKWIDYSNKYGLGYQLTNGSVGVYFNDSTTIILSPNEKNFEYLEYAKGTEKTVMNRQAHELTKHPDNLQKKVTLLKYFKNYMQENLSKASPHSFNDCEKTNNLDFLVKYMRTKHAVMFRLTNQIVQVNFFDHTKLILSSNGLVLTFIDRDRQMNSWALVDVLKMNKHDVISRLKYTRDILSSLTSLAAPTGDSKEQKKMDKKFVVDE